MDAVRARLRRIRTEADHSPVLERGTRREADRLASLLNVSPAPHAEPDGGSALIEAHYVLGWVRWLRADGIRFRRRAAERERRAALDALLPCYLWAPEDPEYVRRLPSAALPALAERAVPLLAGPFPGAPASGIPAGGTGAAPDTAGSIALWRRVLRDLPEDHGDRALALAHLARWLLRRHETGTSPAGDLGAESPDPLEALHLARLAASHPGVPDRPGGTAGEPESGRVLREAVTDALAAALITVGEQAPGTDTAALDEAIRLLEESGGMPAPGEPVTASGAEVAALMARALRGLWERAGDERAAERAVECARRSVGAPAGGDPRRPEHLHGLATALRLRYERTGEVPALEAAVEAAELAVSATAAGAPLSAARWDALGALVQVRCRRTGAAEDVERAVEAARRAVTASRPGEPIRSVALANLATALWLRHERGWDPNALNEAVAALEEAIAALPAEHPLRPALSGNLGAVLRDRYAHVGSEGDLERAVDVLLDACAGSRAGPRSHSAAEGTGPRFPGGPGRDAGENPEGAGAFPGTVPAVAVSRWADLGRALARRHELTGSVDDRRAAADALAVVAAAETARPSLRVGSALHASRLLEPIDPTGAAALAARAVEWLPLVVADAAGGTHGAGRVPAPGAGWVPEDVGEEAAGSALADPAGGSTAERARRALSLVEAGRPVVPGPLPEAVVDPPGPAGPVVSPESGSAERVVGGTSGDAPGVPPTVPSRDAGAARRRLEAVPVTGEGPITLLEQAERFPARVRDVRWATAGTPVGPARLPDPDRLLAAADRGPVVTLLAGRRHGGALVASAGAVRRIELPLLTRNAVGATVDSLRDALEIARDPGASAARRAAAEGEVEAVLRWLWDAVTGPVLAGLGPRGLAPGRRGTPGEGPPRLWWVAAGALARLPLHAALRQDGPGGSGDGRGPAGPGKPVSDVVFSTVPSIRSLLLARERAAALPGPGRAAGGAGDNRPRDGVVVVADGVDTGPGGLPGRELAVVRGLLSDAPAPDRTGRGEPVPSPGGPGVAHLVTGPDGGSPRSVAPGPRVAYLSSYGPPLPAEGAEGAERVVPAPTPTVALHLAGVPSVVGPLWPWAGDTAARDTAAHRPDGDTERKGRDPSAPDGFALELAREFHLRLRRARAEGRGEAFPDTAPILHASVRAARRATGAGPSLWAAPHHVGA
ncbi:hypothetical protein [Streptomyces calidiresistens]|uniref:CHAT domain-containing protein n=1 Tax=Streptomyces calidiresistens TaxID=1485586 RepID=A0A7W3XWD6_9ACTN|nr:hypothetical protein [Streptomyces calidiresistens]MBB0229612.1 hypothetical protein [Streptomyces calidiresistens]